MGAPQVRTPAIAGPADAEDETPNALIVRYDDAERKRFAGLQAEFAMQAFELLRTEGGELYAARWGLAKRLASLDEAEAWLRRAGGRP